MAAEEKLRLAWQAAREGRPGMRDALLLLAIAESGPADAAWVDRCWRRLIASRADNPLATFSSPEQALNDPRVASRLKRLQAMYPPARVRWLLERSAVLKGTFTGRKSEMTVIFEELLGPEEPRPARRADVHLPAPLIPLPGPPKRPSKPAQPQPAPAASAAEPAQPDIDTDTFYLTVLLAIAMFLASHRRASGQETKAA